MLASEKVCNAHPAADEVIPTPAEQQLRLIECKQRQDASSVTAQYPATRAPQNMSMHHKRAAGSCKAACAHRTDCRLPTRQQRIMASLPALHTQPPHTASALIALQ